MNLTTTGKIVINYGDGSGGTTSGARRSKAGTTILSPGLCYHVVGVIRGPTDMDIYLDCINDGGTYSGSGDPNIAYSLNPGNIGRSDGDMSGPANYFKGSVDELGYWGRALTQADVSDLCKHHLCNITSLSEEIEKQKSSFTLVPNPVSDYLTINIPVQTGKQNPTVKIYNLTGLLVKSLRFGETEKGLNISDLESGIYLVKVGTQMQKLVVE